MRKIVYPRMEVLQSLYELTADITPKRFVSTRPPASGEQMSEFLLIRFPQAIRDQGDTYQTTYGQIVCFARDIQGGSENTFRLEQMQAAVMELFPVITDRYHAKMPILLAGGSDNAGFHSLIIQFNITIFKNSKTI